MNTVAERVAATLQGSLSEITRKSVIGRLGPLGGRTVASLAAEERGKVLDQLAVAVRLFARGDKEALNRQLAEAIPARRSEGQGGHPGKDARPVAASRIEIRGEDDIAQARGEAWMHAVRLGFSRFSSVKVATAVSELARNIAFYAGTGEVVLAVEEGAEGVALRLTATDRGPGISAQKLAAIEDGTYRSERGMGQGLAAVRRLADTFELHTAPGAGTTVTCRFRVQP